ncbi:hypothetical protein C900_02968 [Fulvivirga imtechensis AK7]|uniref:N-acetyltransferase domain-containing protein n=1 Tax=Fulvivirga imtechensis AK7 TaxID=1237149 RepID=L8JUD6_9BACT|nr:hypothetical protein C900_02968 [Fulvivirga imtechensis AK7]
MFAQGPVIKYTNAENVAKHPAYSHAVTFLNSGIAKTSITGSVLMPDIILPEKLKNEDIILQELRIEDAVEFYNCCRQLKVVYQYQEATYRPFESPLQFVSRMILIHEKLWTISLAEEPEVVIGTCSLHGYDLKASRIDIGGAVLPGHWDHLYSALDLALQSVRKSQGIKMVVAKTTVKNQIAIDMAEKLGFLLIYSGKREAIVRWVI